MEEVRIGRYTIVRPLGSGAFSTVYLARMEGEGPFVRQVAMKRLHKEATRDPAVVRLLIREAEIGGLMNHDNVVATIDLLKVRDEYFLITEYVDGLDLGDLYFHLMEQSEAMSPGLVAELGHQICRGLGYLHRLTDLEGRPLELVHRDLKPSNVLVHRSGRVKITDFGIVSAKAKEQITTKDTIIGTPRYMSPEQATAADVSPASDLYSLGVMLLQGLTSIVPVKLPYERGTPVRELAPDPEELLADLPADAPEFRPLLRRLLQPAPQDRPTSADEVAEELSRLRTVYPLRQRLSSLVEYWLERMAEDLDEDCLDELPSDRTGDFSILAGYSELGETQPRPDDTERRKYAGAERHPEWMEATDKDEARETPLTVRDEAAQGAPTDRDEVPPFEDTVKDEVPPFEATIKDEAPPFEATVKDEAPPFQPPEEDEPAAAVVPAAPAAVPPSEMRDGPGARPETTDSLIVSQRRRRRAAWLLLPLLLLFVVLVTGALAMTIYHVTRGAAPAEDVETTHDALAGIVVSDETEADGRPAESEAEADGRPAASETEAETETEEEDEDEPEPEPERPDPPPPTEEVPEEVPDLDDPPPFDPDDAGDGMAFTVGEVGGSTRGLPPAGTGDSSPLSLSVSGQRRTLRNSTLHTHIDTGTNGCRVQVHWTVEESGFWSTATLPGDGPAYTWSLAVTAEHRPAILYYVEVSLCGSAFHGTAASPERIVVR